MEFLGFTALHWLVFTILLTAAQWLPYILNQVQVRGMAGAMGYPEAPKPLAPWAQRVAIIILSVQLLGAM